MPAPVIFRVVTEWNFEIGAALLGTSKLQNAVQGVSNAADDALISFQRLGFGIVAQFGLGGSGLAGTIFQAVKASDSFRKSQLALSTALALNIENFADTTKVDTFNKRLAISASIMEEIKNQASKFALPSAELLQFTKVISPILLQKGLAGTNLKAAIILSRNLLKAAPTLGVDPGLIEGQLIRTIEGGASSGDPLFRRLKGETSAFKQAGVSTARQFNALKAAKRFELLQKALQEFANTSDEVMASTMTLSAQMRLLGDAIQGPFSILKPLGDVILIPLIMVLKQFNKVLKNEGAAIIKDLANFIGPLIENPKKLVIGLLQAKELSDDLRQTGSVASGIGIALALPTIVKLATKIPILGVAFAFILKPVTLLAGFLEGLFITLRGVGAATGGFLTILSRLFVPLAAIFGLFQIVSRARAIAKVKDIENFITLTPRISAVFGRITKAVANIFSPLIEVFNEIAEFISPLFQITLFLTPLIGFLESFATVLEGIGKAVILARAGFEGLFFAILQIVSNITSGKIFGLNAGVADAFNAGVGGVIERNLSNLGEEGQGISGNVTNIGNQNVKIENTFKENLEPDRIAFTIKDQIIKAAQQPTQARRRNFTFNGTGG